jgi:hypothetical protein
MRKIRQVIGVAVVSLGLGLAVVGCDSSTTSGKANMVGEKMGDKMGGEKMDVEKMHNDKMGGDKMGAGKMGGDKMHVDKMQSDRTEK